MAFSATVHHEDGLLILEASGPARLGDLCAYMDYLGALARQHHYRRAVMNLLGVEINFSFTDHLNLGSHAAEAMHHLERVASVVPQKYRVGTSEKAAQKMGLKLRTFTSLPEGLAWVRGTD